MIELTRDQARELAVAAQGLARPLETPATKAHAVETVRRLGCVQIDTIHVVARSQYLVLWSRLGHYDPSWLDEMLHPDRALFEYWAHAASLIPIELFPYFRRRMHHYRQNGWHRDGWITENARVLEEVRQVIRERGPVGSAHFDAPERAGPVEPWAWWGGKPANRALDVLWSAGELTVVRRVNFHRIYDLTERVFPEWHDAGLPDIDEERRTLAYRAVRAMGVVLPRWLNDYYRTKWGTVRDGSPKTTDLLAAMADRGDLIPVHIDGLGDGYVATENEGLLDDVLHGATAERTTLLSPFDNLIWDRKRTEDLFDFEYRIECYTPAPKRRYGYFTLPILHRGRLIGRIDPKADRKNGVMILKSIHLEPGVQVDQEITDALRSTLREFARFHGTEEIRIERAPNGLAGALLEE